MAEKQRTLHVGGQDVQVFDVPIVSRKGEGVAEYELEDGAIIRVASPVMSVLRLPSFDVDGKPLYIAIPGTSVTVVEVPDSLRKKS